MSMPSHRLPPPVSQTVGGSAAAAAAAAATDQLSDAPATDNGSAAAPHPDHPYRLEQWRRQDFVTGGEVRYDRMGL